jgi:hypothetical protein
MDSEVRLVDAELNTIDWFLSIPLNGFLWHSPTPPIRLSFFQFH